MNRRKMREKKTEEKMRERKKQIDKKNKIHERKSKRTKNS